MKKKAIWEMGLLALAIFFTTGLLLLHSDKTNYQAAGTTCVHESFSVTESLYGVPIVRVCDKCGQEQIPTYVANVEGVSYRSDPTWHGFDGWLGGLTGVYDDEGNLTYTAAWHDKGTEITISAMVNDGLEDTYSIHCIENGNEHVEGASYTYVKNEFSVWTAHTWKNVIWEETGMILGRAKSCSICGDESECCIWMNTNGYTVTANNTNYSELVELPDSNYKIYYYPYGENVSFTATGEAGYEYYFKLDDVEYTDTISFLVDSAKGIGVNRRKNAFTITYNVNGGIFTDGTTKDKTITLNMDEEVPLDYTCEKEGYKFVGWAKSPSDKRILSSLSMPAEDITLYAMYSLPVSDIKECLLIVWSTENLNDYKEYPMDIINTTTQGYRYSLDGIDISEGLSYSSIDKIKWKILIRDKAGNETFLYSEETDEDEDVVIKKSYPQIVIHKVWNREKNEWEYIKSVETIVEEGELFTPEYLIASDEKYPIDCAQAGIDGAYTVTESKTSYAYYKPNEHRLYFDANDGNCDTEYKTLYYNYFYGELPGVENVTRLGHDFLGWFTEKNGGTEIKSTDRYTKMEDSTVYALWKIHSQNVIYDYLSNGGTSADLYMKTRNYDESIDLEVKAYKSGLWDFVGWNTDMEATEGFNSSSTWFCADCNETHIVSSMPDHDVTLYAIYKKEISAVFIDNDEATIKTKSITGTLYNQETNLLITVPEQSSISGWEGLGWSQNVEASANATAFADGEISITENVTYYGLYSAEVILSYDTNGSPMELDSQTEKCFYNTSGDCVYPSFRIIEAPILLEHSFVEWRNKADGNTYQVNEIVTFSQNTTLIALWDRYPEIEAYDRYFTLEEAKKGKITKEVLLEKVSGTDLEDGLLVNGLDVILKEYNASSFTEIAGDDEVKVTYQATDSHANTVSKTVTINIIDTTVKRSARRKYVRFISMQFFMDENRNLVDKSRGGLEDSSIWRTNESYKNLLEETLLNSKANVETWIFQLKDIIEMKKEI